jgi:stearoyl-CoA desaturase (delta-9 desaturase)
MANQINLILKNIISQPNLWAGVIPMHLLGIFAIYNFSSAPAFWWMASIVGYICIMMLGISACYHRLLSHRGFQVTRATKIFMMWCAALGGQGSPIFWVTIHRGYHHRLSDKPGDPHSPNDGFWHAYIWWMFKITEQDVNPKYAIDILKDKDAMFFHKHYIKIFLLSHLLFAIVCFPYWLYGMLIPALIAFHTFSLTTSVNHVEKFGYKPFVTTDDSVNCPWIWPLALGESWHNNHHHDPKNPKYGKQWWEVDPTYWLISLIRTDKIVN